MIELMITIAVVAVMMAIGLPNVSAWIQNTQLKTAAEGVVSGLQMARAEALRRNTSVRFHLVTTLDSGCKVAGAGATTSANWVVSLSDPAGKCDLAPSETVEPLIVQKKSGAEGSLNAKVKADTGFAVFNGLGRLTAGANLTQIEITNPNGGDCQKPDGSGTMRCLTILVSNGGQVRMCDPAVTVDTDSRSCGAAFKPLP